MVYALGGRVLGLNQGCFESTHPPLIASNGALSARCWEWKWSTLAWVLRTYPPGCTDWGSRSPPRCWCRRGGPRWRGRGGGCSPRRRRSWRGTSSPVRRPRCCSSRACCRWRPRRCPRTGRRPAPTGTPRLRQWVALVRHCRGGRFQPQAAFPTSVASDKWVIDNFLETLLLRYLPKMICLNISAKWSRLSGRIIPRDELIYRRSFHLERWNRAP